MVSFAQLVAGSSYPYLAKAAGEHEVAEARQPAQGSKDKPQPPPQTPNRFFRAISQLGRPNLYRTWAHTKK